MALEKRKNRQKQSSAQEKVGIRTFRRQNGTSSIPESTGDSSYMTHYTWCRVVTVTCVAVIVVWANGGSLWPGGGSDLNRTTIMAKQNQVLESKRYQQFLCAPVYRREIDEAGNPGCAPSKCGRVVEDGLLTSDETSKLLDLAKKGLAFGGSDGGASILDLHSGALSKGKEFVNLYQKTPDIFTSEDFLLYSRIKNRIRDWIASHFGLSSPSNLYLTHPTFFSRLTAKPPATPHDEYWHTHIDKETYGTFHYTALIYLTDYGIDFQGGQFVFVDAYDNYNRTIEPRVGRVSAFTSGVENKHCVKPVTEGVRFALTMGFTCLQSAAIADPMRNTRKTGE